MRSREDKKFKKQKQEQKYVKNAIQNHNFKIGDFLNEKETRMLKKRQNKFSGIWGYRGWNWN